MFLALQGSSPATMTAAILLLTRGRQLGYPVKVAIVGDARDLTPVPGPCVVYAPVLASCGVGRELGTGGTVVVGGPSDHILVSLEPGGDGGWFRVDRGTFGMHGATQAMQRLSADARVPARRLGKQIRRAMEALGVASHPAVLDLLFGAPVPALTRLALALRCGRAISGQRGASITTALAGMPDDTAEPLSAPYDRPHLEDLLRYGSLQWVLDALDPAVRVHAEAWVEGARTLAGEDGGRDLELLYELLAVTSHLVQLPRNAMLPPLNAASDAVAMGIASGLHARGAEDANAQLASVFSFLGGKFIDHADHAHRVDHAPAPEGGDRVALWDWFCAAAIQGLQRADELWPELVDPPS